MWLAKSIYEPLPAIYMVAGASCIGFGMLAGTLLLEALFVVPGIALIVSGLVIALKRRAYRRSRSRSRYNQID
jgi:hypothetical protein